MSLGSLDLRNSGRFKYFQAPDERTPLMKSDEMSSERYLDNKVAIKGKGGDISFPDEGEDISKLNNDEELRVAYIGIEGMHCNSCVKNIEGNISTLSGVKKIEVSLEEKEGKITYSPRLTTGKALEKAIGEMGFEASLKRIVDVLTQNELALSEDRVMDNKEAESLGNCDKNNCSEVKISVKGMTCLSV
ncbi:ATPase Cu transporting protein 7B [Desmophyllum pertusum]|uniref:ATPase Cu transporting protein 7B n=1 Tax=Desmophyllum pertusum TaxID=174260 RepID=A0A9W9ZNQ4_9CNID|nr:ATPase Cu transporting protein 7B [Desmophyllum pertusum]